MPHSLGDARDKIVWAEKHLKTLKDEVAVFLSQDDIYEFPSELHGDEMVVREAVVKPDIIVPVELRFVVSDCAAALRSALDYIAWQLATKYAASPPIVGTNRDICFPIFDDPAGNGANGLAKMARKYSFPTNAVSLIDSVQPYHAGNYLIGLLARLANQDKHCIPLVTVAKTDTATIEVIVHGKPLDICTVYPPESTGAKFVGANVSSMCVGGVRPESIDMQAFRRRIQGTTAAGEATNPPPAADMAREVKVNGQVSVFVALQDVAMPLKPIDMTLEKLVKLAQNIVASFEQFF